MEIQNILINIPSPTLRKKFNSKLNFNGNTKYFDPPALASHAMDLLAAQDLHHWLLHLLTLAPRIRLRF